MAKEGERRKLDEIGARIDAAQETRAPKPRPAPGKFAGAELGWRLTMELVAAIAIGCGIGWGLDSLFGARPLFLVIFVLFGFAAGVRTMMRTVEIANRRAGEGAQEGARNGTGGGDAPDDDTAREREGKE